MVPMRYLYTCRVPSVQWVPPWRGWWRPTRFAEQECLTMRAITQRTFGGPEVLELVDDAPKPAPGPTQVLVRVEATSVNPVELFVRSGAFPLLGEPPFVLGWDVCGVVEQVDPGVHRFTVGDEV